MTTFSISRDTTGYTTRISVLPDFRKRVFCRTPGILDGRTPFESVNYKPYHRLDFRVSKHGIAYVRIEFFGVLRWLVVIDRNDKEKAIKSQQLSKAYCFPIEKNEIIVEDYPDRYADIVTTEDILAELTWNKYLSGFGRDESV